MSWKGRKREKDEAEDKEGKKGRRVKGQGGNYGVSEWCQDWERSARP